MEITKGLTLEDYQRLSATLPSSDDTICHLALDLCHHAGELAKRAKMIDQSGESMLSPITMDVLISEIGSTLATLTSISCRLNISLEYAVNRNLMLQRTSE